MAPQGGPEQRNGDVAENRDIAAIGYVWILSVVVFFAMRRSAFVSFHAKQGMVLFVLSILAWFIPIVGRFLELVILALALLGFLAAAQGQWKDLPIIGPLARFDVKGVRASWRQLLDGMLRMWHEAKGAVSSKKQAPPSPPPQPPQP